VTADGDATPVAAAGTPAEVVAADLEGTLTTGETWRGLVRYLTEARGEQGARAYRRFAWRRLPEHLLARGGLLDRQAFRDRWLRDFTGLLRGLAPDEVRGMAEWVVEHELWPKRRPGLLAELERYRAAGYRLVLASGTYQPVLDAFARRIGAVGLGTPLEVREGLTTGRLLGAVNTGEAKASRLRAFVAGLGTAVAAAFGDTAADVPMLALGARAVAVQPDAELARQARARGWQVLLPAP
jgi:HAD superfamily phosphoserine phosphatase-like hydrolase